MSDTIRPIEPLDMDLPPAHSYGAKPKLAWADPKCLLIDDSYQRDLSRRSMVLIEKMVAEFAWNRFKPPICVETEDGYHCIDGQHTAIAAATLGIDNIPLFIVEAATTQERAGAFVAHNQDRVIMSPMDIHRGKLAAGNRQAQAVRRVCERAEVRLRVINRIFARAGDVAGISAVYGLVKRRGEERSISVLKVLSGRSPVSSAEIGAVETVMCDRIKNLGVERMRGVVNELGEKGYLKATVDAKKQQVPLRVALIDAYMSHLGVKAVA